MRYVHHQKCTAVHCSINSYDKTPVLKDISYEFEKGKMYCIIGKSGAGKTTLLSLLSGLASPSGGRIPYDGKDIAKIDKYTFRSKYNAMSL